MSLLLPLDHPDAPKFWMYESSGVLATAVTRYLQGDDLTPEEVDLLKAYLWQWYKSPVWEPSGTLEALRLRVAAIATRQDIDDIIEAGLEIGMDPL